MKEIIKMSREFFINEVANWLPESNRACINILTREAEGRITLLLENDDTLLIKDNKNNGIVYKSKFR